MPSRSPALSTVGLFIGSRLLIVQDCVTAGVGASCVTLCSGGTSVACGISWPSLGCRSVGGAGPWTPTAGGTMAPGGGKGPEGKGRGGKDKS